MQEMPMMMNVGYASNALELSQIYGGGLSDIESADPGLREKARRIAFNNVSTPKRNYPTIEETQEDPPMAAYTRRIVQVFIADPNENVPLDQSLLYKGDQKLTDATDQELFFEVPLADLLKAHNEKRVNWTDKEATKKAGREIRLEPVKIRDLKMIITNVATF